MIIIAPHTGQFYSRSGVCVSIHLTDEVVPGWEYSVTIFHGLNFFTFIFIFLTYAYIFKYIKVASITGGDHNKRREMQAARKMTLVVITDFCCWIPINIMGRFFSRTRQSYHKHDYSDQNHYPIGNTPIFTTLTSSNLSFYTYDSTSTQQCPEVWF